MPPFAQTDGGDKNSEGDAENQQPLTRTLADDDAPLAAEEPDAVAEVPARGGESDDVEGKDPGIGERFLHLAKAGAGQSVQVDPAEALGVGVIDDEGEGDAAGPALQAVHPIPNPGIIQQIALAAIPEPEAVSAVEGEWQPNTKKFQKEDKRKIREKGYLMRV